MRTMARSSSNRNSASARANSVFPTPVGPRNRKLPIGRFGSFKPERARITASATASPLRPAQSPAHATLLPARAASSSRLRAASKPAPRSSGSPPRRYLLRPLPLSANEWRRACRIHDPARHETAFQIGERAVFQFGGFVQIVGALRLRNLHLHLLNLFAQSAYPLHAFFFVLPLRLQGR